MRTSAPSTISTATPASRPPRAAAAAAASAADAFSDIFGDVFGDIFGGGAPRRPLAGVPRRGPALRARAGSRSGGVRPPRSRSTWRSSSECETCHGTRRGQGLQPRHLRHLRRRGPGARQPGLLPAAADLSALPRHRHHRAQSLRHLPRPGTRAPRAQALGESARRRRHRRSHPPRRARARRAATAVRPGTCTSRSRCASTRSSSATASTSRCEVPVSFATAASGGTVDVPTLDGDVTLKIPAETQSGRVFRLRDKGVKPVRGGARGDLFCRVVIETPVHLSAEQRELIRQLEESLKAHAGKHAPREKGFLEGVKRFFSGGADAHEAPRVSAARAHAGARRPHRRHRAHGAGAAARRARVPAAHHHRRAIASAGSAALGQRRGRARRLRAARRRRHGRPRRRARAGGRRHRLQPRRGDARQPRGLPRGAQAAARSAPRASAPRWAALDGRRARHRAAGRPEHQSRRRRCSPSSRGSAAAALPADFDDRDHRGATTAGKRDAPSGTALRPGRRPPPAARGRADGAAAPAAAGPRRGRDRLRSVRAGDIVGEHTVLFAGPGEQLDSEPPGQDRAVFARGALAAALWLASSRPGRYGMRDFLH